MESPTPYPDVNRLLDRLLSNVQTILAAQFVGMYLYGSLATGDFDPEHSDVDFVVLTASELPKETIRELEMMHERIWADGGRWAHKLEGAYIPQGTFPRASSSHTIGPIVNEGRFYLAPLGSDWVIQRHVMREHGVILAGPLPEELSDPVSTDDLRRVVRDILREWWEPMLEEPANLLRDEYQPFAALTMCRAMYTLEHGTVVSKSAAARWAKDALDDRWSQLIDWALEYGTPTKSTLESTLEFIQYTLERSKA